MNKIIILIGLTFVLVCSGCVDHGTPDHDASPGTENITFVTIGQRYQCSYQHDDPMALIITDTDEWNKFNDKYKILRPPTPDFENYLAIAAFRGNEPNPGYDIHIENITRSQNMMTVMVNMSEYIPERYSLGMTEPYCIIVVKKTDMVEQKENIKFIFYNNKKELNLSYDNGSYVLPKSPSQNEEMVYVENESQISDTEKYGKLEPALYDHLQEMQSDERIKVAIKPTPMSSKTISDIEMRIIRDLENKPDWDTYRVYSEIYKAKEEAYRSKEIILIDYLSAKGFDIIYISNTSHLIFVELTKEEIIAIEARSDADMIYLSETREPETSALIILPKGTPIPFVNIAQEFFDSGYKEKTQKFFVVTNQTELGALPSLGRKVDINLSDYFTIVAFHGHRDAGGSRIDIVNITQSDDEIRVMIGTSGWWGAPVGAEVSPYQVVAVEKSDLTKKGRIEFVFFDMSGSKLDEIEKSISIVDPATPPGTENIPFVTIGAGTGFGVGMGDDPMALTITDAGEWNKLNSAYGIPTPDFENYLAIAVFQGAMPTPGYRIHVENITRSHSTITVMVYMSKHLPGYSCAEMVTYPYCVIAVKKTEMVKRKENIKFIFYTGHKK